MRRRQFLSGAGLAAGASLVVAAGQPAAHAATGLPAAGAGPARSPVGVAGRGGHVGGPPTLTPADIRFPARGRPLRHGSARAAGLLPEHVARIADEAAVFLEPGPGRPAPSHPGFVVLAARDGVIVCHEARGHAVRYAGWDAEAAAPVELPADQWVAASQDTLYDLASISKLFTATVAAQLAEEGAIDLDDPVVAQLPEFAAVDPEKAPITVRQLLTHRSGMVSWIDLTAPDDHDGRLDAIYASALQRPPGTGHEYSDLNLITLAVLMERVTGQGLAELVRSRITAPLGMDSTMFNPPEELLSRIAATEYQRENGRGLVHGTVHDENAWAFDGVAGHAGLFSTAHDLAVFGQMVADGGRYAGTRLLTEKSVRAMITNYSDPGESARGLGFQTDQRFFMDGLCSPVTAGHTGYTGTSLVVDPIDRTVLVLLTNRVHPTREWGTDSAYRRAPARALARAVPVRPSSGRSAWFAGQAEETTATLTAPLGEGGGRGRAGRVEFRLWFDTEAEADTGALEVSSDDGASWTAVPLRLRSAGLDWHTEGAFSGYGGRRWLRATGDLPGDATHVRWVYTTDTGGVGRGVYTDRMRVTFGGRVAFDSSRPRDVRRLAADGWTRSEN